MASSLSVPPLAVPSAIQGLLSFPILHLFPPSEQAHGDRVEQIFKVSRLIILEMFPKISLSFTVEGNYHIHAAILMHDTI